MYKKTVTSSEKRVLSERTMEKLFTGYKRPWNRPSKEIEQKIALLKEREPTLTVREAKEILEKDGIKISIKGIWGVWKRYGYAGFKKKNRTNTWTNNIEWAKEGKIKYEFAKKEFKSAFKLVRGEPFKKMYDRWSEDKRTEILFEINKAKENFEKNLY